MKEMKRALDSNRAIISLVITVLVFLLVFLLSYSFSYYQHQKISKEQNEIIHKILSFDIQSILFNYSCQDFMFVELSSELDYMGSVINILEQRLGKTDKNVLEQKKLYSILEAKHFIYVLEYNKKCNQKINTLLFFYSNQEDYKSAAEKTGHILSSLKADNIDGLMIYSFDYDLKANLIDILRQLYNISQPNTVIVNEKIKITEIQNKAEIEKFLD